MSLNRYHYNFARISRFASQEHYTCPDEFLLAVKNEFAPTCAPSPKSSAKKANIVLGYSGNGKTTFIKAHAKDDDIILSVDETTKVLIDKGLITDNASINGNVIFSTFGQNIIKAIETGKTVWVDGLWLNILTRLALIDALHYGGYQVCLYSLLDEELIRSRLASRIYAEQKKATSIEEKMAVKKFVDDFFKSEHNRNFVSDQQRLNLFPLCTEEFIEIHS